MINQVYKSNLKQNYGEKKNIIINQCSKETLTARSVQGRKHK